MNALATLALVGFLQGLGFTCGFFASNSLLVQKAGAGILIEVYIWGSVLALALSGVLYLLADRWPRHLFSFAAFFLFSAFMALGWWALKDGRSDVNIYFLVRIAAEAVFVGANLVLWMNAADRFSNLEAKRVLPLLMVAEVMGEMSGGLLIDRFSAEWHSVNWIVVWSGILAGISALFLRWGMTKAPRVSVEKEPSGKESLSILVPSFVALMALYWMAFSFLSSGTDLLFNQTAHRAFGGESDALTAFYGRVSMAGNGLVLLFQFGVASFLMFRWGVGSTLGSVIVAMVAALGVAQLWPGLGTVSVAEAVVYFFGDFASVSLMGTVINVLPARSRGRVVAVTEGFGRPAGNLLLVFVCGNGIAAGELCNAASLTGLLVAVGLALLAYPFLFQWAYVRQLLRCLEFPASSEQAWQNAVQALGERKNGQAVRPLLRLLKKLNSNELKRDVILSLGRIGNRQAMRVLMDALGDGDMRTRANAVEALGMLKDRNLVPVLRPFLRAPNNRIRANAVVALHRFESVRREAEASLDGLLRSPIEIEKRSGAYAAGRLGLNASITLKTTEGTW